MAENNGADAASYTDFADRLTDLLFRHVPTENQLNGYADFSYARLNDNALDYPSYTHTVLNNLIQRGEAIGWQTNQGLFVPRLQFMRLGLTLHPGIREAWDAWAPSSHSKIADSHTPRTAIFWAAMSLTRVVQSQDNSVLLLDRLQARMLHPAARNNYEAPHSTLPAAVRQHFSDVSRLTSAVAALLVSREVSNKTTPFSVTIE